MTASITAAQGSRAHLGGIESVRAYAALAIVAFHVIHIAGFDPPQSLMALKWHLGRGVPLFFAVSAFSLAYGYFGRLGSGEQVRDFYLRRLFRIAPLFYLATAFQLAINYPPTWAASHPWDLLLNLTFLFGLSPPHVEGIALASWSIGVEMLFYAILPVILLFVRGLAASIVFAAVSSILAVVYFTTLSAMPGTPPAFIQHGFLFNLPYFAFGLLAYFLWSRASQRIWAPALVAALAGIAALLWGAGAFGAAISVPRGNAIYQTLWAAPLALLCVTMACKDGAPLSWSLTRFLGRISFSLYLAHPHVIGLLLHTGVYDAIHRLPGGSGVQFPLACLVTIGVLIPPAWLLYRFVEAPGMELGRVAVGRLRSRRTLAQAAE